MIKPSDPQILQIKIAKNYQKRYITTRKTKNKQNSTVLQGKKRASHYFIVTNP